MNEGRNEFGLMNPRLKPFETTRIAEYRAMAEKTKDLELAGLLSDMDEQAGIRNSNNTDRHMTKGTRLTPEEREKKISHRFWELQIELRKRGK